jgi:AcrR family transcriptional regulator
MQAPRWERRKDARPAELLAAALELFVERGYAATRLDDVARQAGVSKGTVYLYFPSKEELFKAVVREGLVPLLERGEKMVAEHQGSIAELIRNLVQGWWEGVGLTPYAGLPKLMISECRNFPELGKFYVEEVMARGHKLVRKAVQRGLDSREFRDLNPEYAARLIFAPLVLMVVWRYSFDFCSTSKLEPDAYIEQHLDILLQGLLAPAPDTGRLRAVRSAAKS